MQVGMTKEPPQFPECNEDTRDLLFQMFAILPRNRPSAKVLLQHRVFNEGRYSILNVLTIKL